MKTLRRQERMARAIERVLRDEGYNVRHEQHSDLWDKLTLIATYKDLVTGGTFRVTIPPRACVKSCGRKGARQLLVDTEHLPPEANNDDN